tara:strand:- start:14805 stop:14954 length:150 start_codon:yes stop_codon:yes gene_type:complete
MQELRLELDKLEERLEILTIEGTYYRYVKPTEHAIALIKNKIDNYTPLN